MQIREYDKEIVKAFLMREGAQFPQSRDNPALYVDKVLPLLEKEMLKYPEGCNHFAIESLTNGGQVDSKLVLTPEPWNWKVTEISFYLPPVFNGGVGSSVQEKTK